MRVISIVNQNGGSGKTSVAVNLAYHMEQKNKNVCVIDLDPVANATSHYGIKPASMKKRKSVYELLRFPGNSDPAKFKDVAIMKKGVVIIPAHSTLECDKLKRDSSEKILRNTILKCKEFSDYDHIIIDTPPRNHFFIQNAIQASDHIVIPVKCKEGAYGVVGKSIDYIGQCGTSYSVVPTFHDSRRKDDNTAYGQIQRIFDKNVTYPIREDRSVKYASNENMSAHQYNPLGYASEDYSRLCDMILEMNNV